jgi:ATP-dependent RNA helicase RhlE
LVFTRTKHGADNVVKALKKNNVTAEAIHGDKSQNARQRVLDAFKNKEISVLVATDIAARGIDIESLPFVINFDIPQCVHNYLHRIGRSGRWGRKGVGINFVTQRDMRQMKIIEQHYHTAIEELSQNWASNI